MEEESPSCSQLERKKVKKRPTFSIEGYPIEGISIGGQETCVIFSSLKIAFDIGRCPQRAISQDFLFISHGHMDHIGGLPMYVATRGLYSMKPPTIFVPVSLKEHVEKLFEVHRNMDQSELKHNLIGLNIGEEYQIRRDVKVKAFKTYHRVPSQGYLIYTVKQKLKQEFVGLSGEEIKKLKLSGVEITNTTSTPEIAFTGDTTSDFILDLNNSDVLKSKILVMECTFVDNTMSIEHARDKGHTHLFEITNLADRFLNKAILLIHFSARYRVEEIEEAVSKMPPSFTGRVFALTEELKVMKKQSLSIEGYQIEGISIGGQETCIIFPSLKLGFDIGRCPKRAISLEFLFISHGHMDHIGGLPMYVANRELYSMKPPTIFVPAYLKEFVEKLFEVYRKITQSELKHNLIGLNIGEEYQLRKDLKVKAFKTYHVIPSQGYLIYTVKQSLKQEFVGLSGEEIKKLKLSGVEITNTISTPEIAFTGDTTSDFILDLNNSDVLKARILIMECTFVDNVMSIEHARDFGHTHLFEITNLADRFLNKAILLIHFSARYYVEEIEEAISKMPPSFTGRVFSLTEGI